MPPSGGNPRYYASSTENENPGVRIAQLEAARPLLATAALPLTHPTHLEHDELPRLSCLNGIHNTVFIGLHILKEFLGWVQLGYAGERGHKGPCLAGVLQAQATRPTGKP